jgi:hypothetical protein
MLYKISSLRAPLDQRIFSGILEEFLNDLFPHSFSPLFFLQNSYFPKSHKNELDLGVLSLTGRKLFTVGLQIQEFIVLSHFLE